MAKLSTFLVLAFALSAAAGSHADAEVRPADATVAFRNALPKTFELRRVRYWVDGLLRYDGVGAFDARLEPGAHIVSIEADYRLRDPVFAYVNSYGIRLRSAQHVSSEPGRAFVARAVETGGVTVPVDRRAQLIWR
jgi:hypothetical protein